MHRRYNCLCFERLNVISDVGKFMLQSHDGHRQNLIVAAQILALAGEHVVGHFQPSFLLLQLFGIVAQPLCNTRRIARVNLSVEREERSVGLPVF